MARNEVQELARRLRETMPAESVVDRDEHARFVAQLILDGSRRRGGRRRRLPAPSVFSRLRRVAA